MHTHTHTHTHTHKIRFYTWHTSTHARLVVRAEGVLHRYPLETPKIVPRMFFANISSANIPKNFLRTFGNYFLGERERLKDIHREKKRYSKDILSLHHHAHNPSMHTRRTRMSRALNDVIDQSYRTRRETFTNSRRPRRFLNRTIKGWIRRLGATSLRRAGFFAWGSLRLWYRSFIYDSYGSNYGVIANRLTDPESYTASLDLPRRQPDVSTTRTMSQVVDLAETGCHISMLIPIALRYRLW